MEILQYQEGSDKQQQQLPIKIRKLLQNINLIKIIFYCVAIERSKNKKSLNNGI